MTRIQRVFFRIGAWASLFTAALHLVGHFQSPTPQNETEATLQNLMRTYKLDLPGSPRSMHELMSGFSLIFSVFLAVLGVLSLVIVGRHHADAGFMRRVTLVNALGTAVLLAISLTHFFIIPTVCCAVIFVGFAAALFAPS